MIPATLKQTIMHALLDHPQNKLWYIRHVNDLLMMVQELHVLVLGYQCIVQKHTAVQGSHRM